ncbi:MAG: hypothetical protein U0821_14655 [Chloroflexota bacterium]
MRVRHITSAANVRADGSLVDPLAVRHGAIVAGRIASLGGQVDPTTHLNADFDEHSLDDCVVAESLEIGAAVVVENDDFVRAWAADQAYTPLGAVDMDSRLRDWRAALAASRVRD